MNSSIRGAPLSSSKRHHAVRAFCEQPVIHSRCSVMENLKLGDSMRRSIQEVDVVMSFHMSKLISAGVSWFGFTSAADDGRIPGRSPANQPPAAVRWRRPGLCPTARFSDSVHTGRSAPLVLEREDGGPGHHHRGDGADIIRRRQRCKSLMRSRTRYAVCPQPLRLAS